MRGVAGFLVVSLMVLGLAVLPGTRSYAAGVEPAANMIIGDVNCDGDLTAADPLAALQVISGLTDGCGSTVADVDCSGGLGLADVLLLRRHSAGLEANGPAGCPAIGSAYAPTGPSTDERVEAALAAGQITKGQALLYHIQAELDPSKLPLQFRGPVDPGALSEMSAPREAAAAWDTLSTAEQDALRPYLLPPSDPGSWAAAGGASLRAVQWQTVSNARIKVWWQTSRPEDEAKANAILQELDTYIWPDLINYMGAAHAPLSDAGYKGDGGDGRYDVYLVHNAPTEPGKKPVLGWVTPSINAQGGSSCKVTPTYMILNSRIELSPEFLSTVAHEFMHSVQFTYNIGNCDDYTWMMESTATWVESWLYPEVNSEHAFAFGYLDELDKKPLEHWEYKDAHQYGSYLLWFHAHQNEGLYYAVRDAWNASTNADSLVAVNTALAGAGGLKEVWPESALYNWNRDPYQDFSTLDQVGASAAWNDTEVQVVGGIPTSYAVPTDVGHMQQRHLHFTIAENVKTLTFINPLASHYDPAAKLQAILQVNGEWQSPAVDWTNEDRVSFCFDKPNEKITELEIIITNSNFTDRTHVLDAGPGELVASPNGCKGWVGSASAELTYFDTTFTITVDNLRFAPDPENPGNDRYDFYELVESGDATWHVSGTWFGNCTPSGTMQLLPPGTGPTAISGYFHVDKLNNSYNVHISGNSYEDTLIISCPNSDPWARSWPLSSVLFDGAQFRPIPEDHHIDEEYTELRTVDGGTWKWSFHEVE